MELRAALAGGRPGPVQCAADFVEPVPEQVAVGVEGYGRGAVSEHLLDDLDVGAGGDGETGRGVSELVGVQVGYAEYALLPRCERAHWHLGTVQSMRGLLPGSIGVIAFSVAGFIRAGLGSGVDPELILAATWGLVAVGLVESWLAELLWA